MAKQLTIDGKEITARDGATIIEAAHEAGIVIPHYCYHPKLSVAGNCRMCLIELEGRPKLEISCNTPVADDMVVHTNSPKVVEGRRGVLEFLLINHPLDCPICDQAGECGLQDYYMSYGLYQSRFQEEKVHGRKVVDFGPDVVFDSERCILCTRCVRFCDEVTHTNELGIFERGDSAQIATFPGKQLDNPYAGNTVDICPVGALTSKDFRFKIRVWFLQETPSVCPGCARGCNVSVHHHDGRVYRLKPRRNDGVNDTWMCDAGRFGYRSLHENRLLEAAVRDEAGELAPASMQEALAHAADLLRDREPANIAVLAAPQGTNEDCYLLAKLTSEVLPGCRVAVTTGEPGDEDDFLLRADRNPNTRGARDMGLPAPASPDELARLAADIEAGSIQLLVAVDVDLGTAFGAETFTRLAAKLRGLIVQGSTKRPDSGAAHVLLPSAAYAERDGTFTNFQGRIQRINAAYAPPGAAQPAWRIYRRLANLLGADWNYPNHQAVWADIADTVPGYGVDYADIGEQGCLISSLNPPPSGRG